MSSEQRPSAVREGGRVASVNVGTPRVAVWEGHELRSAIWKDPVTGPVAVRRRGLDGDEHVGRTHGTERKAVLAYALEDLRWWERELDRPLGPGSFGENLTLEGLDLRTPHVGERWRIGTAVLEVTQPRLPCAKLAMRFGDRLMPERFRAAGRAGAYFLVVEQGVVAAGDAAALVSSAPASAPTLLEDFRARCRAEAQGRQADAP